MRVQLLRVIAGLRMQHVHPFGQRWHVVRLILARRTKNTARGHAQASDFVPKWPGTRFGLMFHCLASVLVRSGPIRSSVRTCRTWAWRRMFFLCDTFGFQSSLFLVRILFILQHINIIIISIIRSCRSLSISKRSRRNLCSSSLAFRSSSHFIPVILPLLWRSPADRHHY